MRRLRILTGRHAGAQLRLAGERYLIGPGDDADILVSDWPHEPVVMTLTEGGAMLAANGGLGDEADPAKPLDDLMPRQFGEIVLCIGPADEAWPSDVDLLARLMDPRVAQAMQPPVDELPPAADAAPGARDGSGEASPRRRWRGTVLPMALAAAGSVCVLAVFVGLLQHQVQAHAKPVEPLLARVSRAVQATGVAGLAVKADARGDVSVEGMVADRGEAERVRAAVAVAGAAGHVAQHFAVAADVSQSIGDALANPGLTASYRGNGVFTVSGSSADMEAVRAKLRRIATDLGPAVTRIEVAAQDLPPPATLDADALMDAGDLKYVQTKDGTKHLMMVSPPPAASLPPAEARP
jgi:type III secretion protein D